MRPSLACLCLLQSARAFLAPAPLGIGRSVAVCQTQGPPWSAPDDFGPPPRDEGEGGARQWPDPSVIPGAGAPDSYSSPPGSRQQGQLPNYNAPPPASKFQQRPQPTGYQAQGYRTPEPEPEDEIDEWDLEDMNAAELTVDPAGELMEFKMDDPLIPAPESDEMPTPKLITFDAVGTLIRPAQTRGEIYRETFLRAICYSERLPPPMVFDKIIDETYEALCRESPLYGLGKAPTSSEWWTDLVAVSLLEVCERHDIDQQKVLDNLEAMADDLFYEIYSGPEAWERVDDVDDMLEALALWRDEGGPQLGVVSNCDERLSTILENLGLLQFFDHLIISRETGAEKPNRQIFDAALSRAGLANPIEALHVGGDVEKDIIGAMGAGWQSIRMCHGIGNRPRHGLLEDLGYEYVTSHDDFLRVFGVSKIVRSGAAPPSAKFVPRFTF
ncbi:unnamed protein product [Chrysoparadoxa australica]